MLLDIHEIIKIIPHRYPFLLVDRIIEMEVGKRAVLGSKMYLPMNRFFRDIFPNIRSLPEF